MASGLSAGTTHAPDFNQAARNVACVAHLVSDSLRDPGELTSLGFVLLAPSARIAEGIFAAVDKTAICTAVTKRAETFGADAMEWCRTHFEPISRRCSVSAVSWETVLSQIAAADPIAGKGLSDFYKECLRHNPFRPTTTVRSV